MTAPNVILSLPFGEAKLIAHSSRSVLVRSPRDGEATQCWRVNGVEYIVDAHLEMDEFGWRPKNGTAVYVRRPRADREPTDAAIREVRETVVAAVVAWAETPDGQGTLALADVADRDDAVQELRGRARELRERAAELRGLAKRVAGGQVPPDEGRKALDGARR